MSKRLILVLALAFVIGLSLNAYAEVQNVKVSGDVVAVGAYRNNLDLAKPVASGNNTLSSATWDDKAEFLATIVRVRVDADLTDNVIATVRLLNEREWNGEAVFNSATNNNIGLNGASPTINQVGITADLVYVTLKEFLYSPLTLRAGRQELRFQNGWIIGDPDTNVYSGNTNLAAGDLSARKAFDSLRATLDYNPLVVDLVYAKVAESSAIRNDDITLAGANASYELDKATTLEGFFWSKSRGTDSTAATNVDTGNATSFDGTSTIKQKTDKVHTVGGRVVNKSINNLTLDFTVAYQFGTYNPRFDPNARWLSATRKAQTSNRKAWGTEFAAIYDLKDIAAIAKYHPMLMGAFVYLSGESRDKIGDKTYKGWDAMFEDQTFGHLTNAMFGFSNIKLAGLSAMAKPTDDTSVKLDYVMAWFNKKFPNGRLVNLSGVSGARTFNMGRQSYAGQEVDLTVTYDYTEDVQFSLLGGIFVPGKSINKEFGSDGSPIPVRPTRATATELIGSMKVTF